MQFNTVILWVAAIGILLGAIDRIIGNRFGFGKKLEEGLSMMGPLALTMAGLICLAPVIGSVLGPVVGPLLRSLGCDPAMLGTILPNDTGGYPLAMALADDEQIGRYAGIVVASMFGCTLTFMLPMSIMLIPEEDQPYVACGTLIGLICVPVASLLGGVLCGLPLRVLLRNLLPVAVLAVIFAVGLKRIPKVMFRFCKGMGWAVFAIATAGLAAAGFESLTGVVLIPGMAAVGEAMTIVGQIGIVLMGMFPILELFQRLLKRPLEMLGARFGLDVISSSGLLITLCNPVPVMSSVKQMNSRGKVLNCAFFVCSAAAIGDHLAFAAGVEPEYIRPMVVAKLVGGMISLLLCIPFLRDTAMLDCESRKIREKKNT